MKYQKRPVQVEAFQWGVDIKPKWAAEAFVEGTLIELDTGIDLELHIETLEGEMVAELGDFVIQGVHGELYSCKPDIFEETYIKVDDTDRISPDDIGNDIEETIEIVPDMKWFVRSKEKYEADPVQGIPESGYLYLTDGGDDYGISYCEMTTFKDEANQFDTKAEAEKWTNPDTEAVQLPVEED